MSKDLQSSFETFSQLDGILNFDPGVKKQIWDFLDQHLCQNDPSLLARFKDFPSSNASKCSPTCGYVFQIGDIIYRCKDCGADGTCVLCSSCYQDCDHQGHSVSYTLCKNLGGSCDCGEPESWKRTLSCPSHNSPPLPISSPFDTPFLDHAFQLFTSIFAIVAPTFAAHSKRQRNLKNNVLCVIYNDEHHSFQQVINILGSAFDIEPDIAMQIAEHVDQEGRASICEIATVTPEVERHFHLVRATDLTIMVHPIETVKLENVCHLALCWVQMISEKYWPLGQKIFDALIAKVDGTTSLETFLTNDSVLWKRPRIALNSIFTKTGLATNENKFVFAALFLRHLDRIFDNFMRESREPELSIVHFSVQLFTISSVVQHCIEHEQAIKRICKTLDRRLLHVKEAWRQDRESSKARKISFLFQLLTYFVSDQSAIRDTVEWWWTILNHLENIDVQICEPQVHLEYERSTWVDIFNISIELPGLSEKIAEAITTPESITKTLGLAKDRIVTSIANWLSILADNVQTTNSISRPAAMSFHHPLFHAAALLVRKLFQLSAPHDFAESLYSVNSYVDILDCFTSQLSILSDMKNGLWNRNGLSLKQQVRIYTGIAFRHVYLDIAVFWIKLCGIVLSPEIYVNRIKESWNFNQILDRFGSDGVDSKKVVDLLESFGEFWLSIIYGVSFSDLTSDEFAKEVLVATLFIGPASYNEICSSRLPVFVVEHGKFESIMAQIADLRALSPFSDANYEIKPDYKSCFNPFYWLYSRQDAENSKEYFKKRFGDLESADLISRSSLSFRESSLLRHVVLHPEFLDMICTILSLPNVHKNLKVVECFAFIFVISCELDDLCVMSLAKRQDIITAIKSICEKAPECLENPVIRLVLTRTDAHRATQTSRRLTDSLIAQKRFEALGRMTAGQTKFLDENPDAQIYQPSLMTSNEKITFCTAGICIICQEPADSLSKPYGILSCIQKTTILKVCKDLDYDWHKSPGKIATSCLHLAHYCCFAKLASTPQNNDCPMCKAYFTSLIPVMPELKSSQSPTVWREAVGMGGEKINQNFSQWMDKRVSEIPSLPKGVSINMSRDELNELVPEAEEISANFFLTFFDIFLYTLACTPQIAPYKSDFQRFTSLLEILKCYLAAVVLSDEHLDKILSLFDAIGSCLGGETEFQETPFEFLTKMLLYTSSFYKVTSEDLVNFVFLAFLAQLKSVIFTRLILMEPDQNPLPHEWPEGVLKNATLMVEWPEDVLKNAALIVGESFEGMKAKSRSLRYVDFKREVECLLVPWLRKLLILLRLLTGSFIDIDYSRFMLMPYEELTGLLGFGSFESSLGHAAPLKIKFKADHFEFFDTYSLVSLPNRFDHCIISFSQKECENCHKRPFEPALCLICGKILCAKSYCCSRNYVGECNAHTASCGRSSGIFLLIRKCAVLLISVNGTCIAPGPYTDIHDQTDFGLKCGKPLYLKEERFDEITKLWLTHGIPSLISRGSDDNGFIIAHDDQF